MTDMAARIAAATASGDVQGLAALAIELAQENSRLAGHAAALEEAEAARKAKQNARVRRHRNVTQRDETLHPVTERDATLRNGTPPSPPSPSLLSPTPPNNSSPTPSSPELPPRGAKQPAPWLGRFGAAWHERYDGDMPSGPAVGPLRRLIRTHGEEEVFRRWGIYLAATEGRFAAPAKFAATWGDWDAPPVTVSRGQLNTPTTARAATLWERYKAANLLTKWERPEYERIGGDLVTAGHYASVGDFLAELRQTKPWTLRDARTDGWAINEIAARLAAPQKVSA